MSSTELATKDEVAAAYHAILTGELPEGFGASDDAEGVSRAIVERIISAEDFADAFNPQELPAWRDTLLDIGVLVRKLHLNKSTVAGGSLYAVVDVERLDDGSALTVSCGGRNVLAQLVKLVEKGWTDKPVKMIAKRTSEGYDALWLTAA